MHYLSPANWVAGPLVDQIVGRTLNSIGVLFLAVCVAIAASAGLPDAAFSRTTVGLLAAGMLIAAGDLCSRRGGSQWFCFGTSLTGGGYLIALWFARATFYVSELPGRLDMPYLDWLLELSIVALATVHASRNRVLRWVALPATMAVSLNIFWLALHSTEVVSVSALNLNLKVTALGSMIGLVWWLGLSFMYRRLGDAIDVSTAKVAELEGTIKLAYRIAHEACFVAAGITAVILPHFWTTAEYAPLWWSLEMPLLLVVCWRSNSFIKHTLLMAIWSLSAVLLLINNQLELSALVRMAVPVSGLAMALTYRLIPGSNWPLRQKAIGYSVYLYASTGVALLVPVLQLGIWEAMPYWLLQSMVIFGLALRLEDRGLQRIGFLTGAVSLVLFGAHWQEWTGWLTIVVTVFCYAASVMYGWVHEHKKDGWPKSKYCLIPGAFTLSNREAYYMERLTALAGYATLIAGAILLLGHPYNTICWGVSGLVLIGFGFLTNRVWHRVGGLVALTLASGKLTIIDLSGASGLAQTLVGFLSIGGCCVIAGIMYTNVAASRKRQAEKDKQNQTPPPGGDDKNTPGGDGNADGGNGAA